MHFLRLPFAPLSIKFGHISTLDLTPEHRQMQNDQPHYAVSFLPLTVTVLTKQVSPNATKLHDVR